jgi:hypothetical protein
LKRTALGSTPVQTEDELVMRVDDDDDAKMMVMVITMVIMGLATGKYSSICPG